MKTRRFRVSAAIAASLAWAALAANAQTKPVAGDAGRTLALLACTGCHVVATDQPFKPVYVGEPHPPDFKEIANRPNTTAASLQRYLETLPAVPENSHMPNLLLSSQEIRNVVAYIVSLRDRPAAPTQ